MNLPAIRGLFGDSVVFTNAFCASPLCAPARAALATGRYTYITANGERAHDGHETILRPSDVIFQEYLKATGYKTKHAGKGHLGTQKFMDAFDENDNAWDRWAPPIYDDELYLAYLRRLGVKPQRYKKEIRGLQQDRKTPHVSVGGWIEQADGKPFPLEAQYTHYLVRRAVEKLDAALAEKDGRPIYLQLDIFDPHQPFSIPAGLEDREKALRGACSELPESYDDVQAHGWKPFPQRAEDLRSLPAQLGTLRSARPCAITAPPTRLQMEVVDRALAKFLDALKQRGLYDESILIFTSDHGEMNGRQAMVDKGVYLYPDVLRVPLAVKMPKSFGASGRTVESPVCHLDIAPTLLGVAGVEPMERLDGQSLMPHLQGTAPPADRELFFECGWHIGVNFACATQTWTRGGEHYLYSYNAVVAVRRALRPAPRRMRRTWPLSPEHKKTHAEMVARLGAMLERDPRWIGYSGPFRIDHYFDLPKPKGDVQMFRPL